MKRFPRGPKRKSLIVRSENPDKTNLTMLKLNLGCGPDYREGWVNIDVDKRVKTDRCVDFLEKGIPFKANSVDEIFCKNLFEHVPNPLAFLLEMKRVLKKSGRAVIVTSNASYLLYHWPRKKAFHDSYNIGRGLEDQHYFLFQRGHLEAFTQKARMKLKKLEYYISNVNAGRDRQVQKFLGRVLGKKFGYSDFLWEVKK